MTSRTSFGFAASAAVGVGYFAKNALIVLCLHSQLETWKEGERDEGMRERSVAAAERVTERKRNQKNPKK